MYIYTQRDNIFYFPQKHCKNDLFVKDVGYYTNVFCAKMMKRNLEIEHSGFPSHQQDLFMENSKSNQNS